MSHDYTATHATLLARLADGADAAAWREFHDRYGALILNFARRRNLQPADCDDIVQETLVALTRAMPGFEYDPAKGRFRSYLKTVVLRTIFRKSCQNPRPQNLEHIEEATRAAVNDEAVESLWEEEWRQHHLRQAMRVVENEFNTDDRTAFRRYAVEGRDAGETARELGMSVDQVYQAKSRILKRIAQLIELQVSDEG